MFSDRLQCCTSGSGLSASGPVSLFLSLSPSDLSPVCPVIDSSAAPVVADYPPPDPFHGEADPYAGGYEPTAGELSVADPDLFVAHWIRIF